MRCQFLKSILFIVCLVLLAGCATTRQQVPVKQVMDRCDMPNWLAAQLRTVQIISVGQTITLVVPSQQLFLPNTANMKTTAHSQLQAVACVLKFHDKVAVSVKGHANFSHSSPYNKALSRLQAAKVAQYLWQQGVDARLLSAEGMGAAEPIASNATASGQEKNRRIEIKFRWLEKYPG